MKKPIKKHKSKNIIIKLSTPLIIIVVLMLTLGYSAFSDNLLINGSVAFIHEDNNIEITGISQGTTTNGGVFNSEYYDDTSITSNIELPNANSKVTYSINITNLGNTEMAITSITGLPNNLNYRISNYILKDTLCDNQDPTKCKLGSVTTINLTIEYNNKGYNANNTTYSLVLEFNFAPVEWVARIGNTKYERVQKAVEAVPISNNETTIVILHDATERITVSEGQTIFFDIGDYTLNGNPVGQASGNPVIETYGAVRIANGTIATNVAQGAINVQSTGSLIMTGGSVIATGTRQDIYNNGGTVLITGTAYLSSTTNERGSVHNLNNGTLTITGGTIISENFSGIVNASGTLTIGVKDGNVNTNTPVIRGKDYGVYNSTGTTSTSFNFYDGVLKGRVGAIFDDTKVADTETGYDVVYSGETIAGQQYQTAVNASLNSTVTVKFYHNDGTDDYTSMTVIAGNIVGATPNITRTDYVFEGWFTAPPDSIEVKGDTVVNTDINCYAKWTHVSEYYIATINDNNYYTLAAAIAAVTTSTPTTITMIRDTSENVEIPKNRNITINLNNHTINSPGDAAVIVNKGNCTIFGGTITTASQNTSAVNNESTGTFNISSGTIKATGKRQAVYNNAGTVNISGTTYLISYSTERATVQNVKSGNAVGTINITGGTIISTYFSGINNAAGTLNIGTQGTPIDNTTPIIRGADYGVINSATFNFYDGKLMGVTNTISGNVIKEQNSTTNNTTENIDNITYKVTYLS